jgi:hypothetical protein
MRTLSEKLWTIILLSLESLSIIGILITMTWKPYEYQGSIGGVPFGLMGLLIGFMVLTYLAFSGTEVEET